MDNKRGILNEVQVDSVADARRRKKEARKNFSTLLPLVVIYWVLMAAVEFIGFLHPLCWVASVTLAAVVCVVPVVYMLKKYKKPGAFAILGIIWCLITILLGIKLSFSGLIITLLAMIVSEMIRWILGYGSREGICFGYAAASLLPLGHRVYLWTDTTKYMELIAKFFGETFADKMGNYATEIVLFAIIIITVAVGYYSARFAIRFIRTDKKITDREQENSIDFEDR
ncbi:MAG: MptD family putative ECF transporter S component [Eubacterium sp.]|nr:MptD family putative ECF transporter S component [Eubacterium sp.]